MSATSRLRGIGFLVDESSPDEVVIPDDMGADERLLMRSIEEFAAQEVAPHLERIEQRDEEVILPLFRKARRPRDLHGRGAGVARRARTQRPGHRRHEREALRLRRPRLDRLRPPGHRDVAAHQLRDRGAARPLPRALHGRTDHGRLRPDGARLGVGRHEHPHDGRAERTRDALRGERREAVDHQRRVGRSVHPVRQGGRHEVHRLPARAGVAGADRRRPRAPPRPARFLGLRPDARRRGDSRRERARRDRARGTGWRCAPSISGG